jgi:hypothetical protein
LNGTCKGGEKGANARTTRNNMLEHNAHTAFRLDSLVDVIANDACNGAGGKLCGNVARGRGVEGQIVGGVDDVVDLTPVYGVNVTHREVIAHLNTLR